MHDICMLLQLPLLHFENNGLFGLIVVVGSAIMESTGVFNDKSLGMMVVTVRNKFLSDGNI